MPGLNLIGILNELEEKFSSIEESELLNCSDCKHIIGVKEKCLQCKNNDCSNLRVFYKNNGTPERTLGEFARNVRGKPYDHHNEIKESMVFSFKMAINHCGLNCHKCDNYNGYMNIVVRLFLENNDA